MGSVSVNARNLTLKGLILEEIGVSGDLPWELVVGAYGDFHGDRYDEWKRHYWFVIEHPEHGREMGVALCATYQDRGDRYHAVKIVTESMGPAADDVPLKVWAERPEPPPGTYAAEWRAGVERIWAHWPLKLHEMIEAERFGEPFEIRHHDGAWDLRRHPVYGVLLYQGDNPFKIPARIRKARVRPGSVTS